MQRKYWWIKTTLDWTVSLKFLRIIFKRLIMHTFQKQPFSKFYKICLLKNVTKFTEKHRCWSLCKITLKVLQHRCFSVNFRYFFNFFHRTPPYDSFWNFLAIASLKVSLQKQSFPYVLQNRCSLKFHIIHRKTPVPQSLF